MKSPITQNWFFPATNTETFSGYFADHGYIFYEKKSIALVAMLPEGNFFSPREEITSA